MIQPSCLQVRVSIRLETWRVPGVVRRDLQRGDPNYADFLFLFISSKLTVMPVDSSLTVWSRLNSVELDGMFVWQISSRDFKKNSADDI